MSQFVYVLKDRNTHLLKIGISVDPEFRAKQVSKDFGCDAALAGVLEVQDALKTERFIHGMLSECRVVGEWFEVSDKQKNYLLAYFSDRISAERPKKTLPVRLEGKVTHPEGGAINFSCKHTNMSHLILPSRMIYCTHKSEGHNYYALNLTDLDEAERLRDSLNELISTWPLS